MQGKSKKGRLTIEQYFLAVPATTLLVFAILGLGFALLVPCEGLSCIGQGFAYNIAIPMLKVSFFLYAIYLLLVIVRKVRRSKTGSKSVP